MDNHCLSCLWKISFTLLDRLQFYSHDLALDLSHSIYGFTTKNSLFAEIPRDNRSTAVSS